MLGGLLWRHPWAYPEVRQPQSSGTALDTIQYDGALYADRKTNFRCLLWLFALTGWGESQQAA